jgi:16S rRNA (cytosine1402-N4)-methyltransferase
MRHIPVLLQQIIEGLNISEIKDRCAKEGRLPVIIDCNLGDGGHSEAIIRELEGRVHLVGVDLDPEAIMRARKNINDMVIEEKKQNQNFQQPKLTFIQDNFRNLQKNIQNLQVKGELLSTGDVSMASDEDPKEGFKADAILFDLGISSYEIEESGRGFAFKKDEPLLMTFGESSAYSFTASDIVNTWDEENIADIIYAYGEDRYSRRIAKRIVEEREKAPITTTAKLADIIKSSYPSIARYGKIHPATKTFQALRIAVNDELQSIKDALPQAVELLRSSARLTVISFHSLEDRIVKNFFKESSESGQLKILTKKPIVPDEEEIKNNPRSRSSKLRIAEKTA